MTDTARSVAEHYARPALLETLRSALQGAGLDPDRLDWRALAPVDQFHTGGVDATLHLARLAGVARGQHVLDVGGGIGGPARALAATVGCRVTVLDLTEEYCRTGEGLTRAAGLEALVRFQQGDACAIPFADASFDVAWTQHSSMNVPDKAAMYAEIARVLRPGGLLALHEIVAGPEPPPHFPLPWAAEPDISHLARAADLRALLRGAGLLVRHWRDATDEAIDWFRSRLAAAAKGPPPPLGLHLLAGPGIAERLRNLLRSLEEDRVRVVEGVLER